MQRNCKTLFWPSTWWRRDFFAPSSLFYHEYLLLCSDTSSEINDLESIQGDWWILKGQNCGQDELWNGGYDAYPCQLESFVIGKEILFDKKRPSMATHLNINYRIFRYSEFYCKMYEPDYLLHNALFGHNRK